MASLETALTLTLVQEGGVNASTTDPGNKWQGGYALTNRGITMQSFTSWRTSQKRPPPSVLELRDISMGEVSAFYRYMYWNKISGDDIKDQSVATVLFDAGVLNGPITVIKMAQAVAAGVTGQALLADGLAGPKTIAAINACQRRPLLEPLVNKLQARFLDIVAAAPAQRGWLPIWLRRAAAWMHLADG